MNNEKIKFYQFMKEKTFNLPKITVSEEEFVKMMMLTGKSESEARMHAKISKMISSSVMIDDKMVKIGEENEMGTLDV